MTAINEVFHHPDAILDLKVISELRKEYPSVTLKDGVSLSTAIMEIYSSTGDQFVFIIDEYDVIIRDQEYSSEKIGKVSIIPTLSLAVT